MKIREKRKKPRKARQRERESDPETERALRNNSQQCDNHEFDNSGPDLAGRGQVPNELRVGKVSSAFKLCGHF